MAVVYADEKEWEMRRGHNCPTIRERKKERILMMRRMTTAETGQRHRPCEERRGECC